MRKYTYFGDLDQSRWPDPSELKPYFLDPTGDAWPHEGGNDSWGLHVTGLNGTQDLPDESDQVNVYLYMTGYPDLGVHFTYGKWDGRTKEKLDYQSEGNPQKEREIVYSMHGTPMSAGSFVPFSDAYKVVKEFIETDGALPSCIKWGRGPDIPREAWFYPRMERW
jgi:hypothetical protein